MEDCLRMAGTDGIGRMVVEMSDITVEPYYARQANELVTMLFDKRFLNDELARDSIDWLEDYLGYIIQSSSQSAAKCALLTAKLRDRR